MRVDVEKEMKVDEMIEILNVCNSLCVAVVGKTKKISTRFLNRIWMMKLGNARGKVDGTRGRIGTKKASNDKGNR